MLINKKEEFKKILNELKIKLEKIDREIFKNINKKRYINVKIQPRTITTEFGQVHFKRHIYKYYNNKTNKWVYIALLDKKMNIPKYSKLDISLVNKIEEQLGSGKRYQDIIDMFGETQISKMSITRIFQNKKLAEKYKKVENKIEVEDGQRIYINMDDTYPKVRKLKKIGKAKVRVISFNLGYDEKKSTPKRKVLKCKKIMFFIDKESNNAEEAAKAIMERGNVFFDNFDNAQLVIGGDGAPWIQNTADILYADYVLDKYHAFNYLRMVFNINPRNPKQNLENYFQYEYITNLFNLGKYEEFIRLLTYFANKKIINYFVNNRRGIKSYAESWNIGVSAESDVSKLVKNPLGYKNRIYSLPTFVNILQKIAYSINNC